MKKVLVIGETCIDVFKYGICERMCPEAPVPVFVPTHEISNRDGMARNVYKNLLNLGLDCGFITYRAYEMPKKIRYIDEVSNQMILRVDEDDEVQPITTQQLESIKYDEYDAIIISDYDKGFLNIMNIMDIASKHPMVFLDTKKEIGHWCEDVKFIKVNEKEFYRSERYFIEDYPNNLIVTLGRDGALYHNKNIFIKPEKRVDVRDVAGAGDTFLAAFVADYLKNNDICTAIQFANKCASWVVTQRGVVAVDLTKI
ncbi:MAG: PfkB family carbohydrate kinase [bacterium]